MTASLDPDTVRLDRAELVRGAKDITIPDLEYWNASPCAHHDTPRPDCEFRSCGGALFAHQRVGVSWLYLREKGLLADSTGAGKTNQVLGLLALMKQKDELTDRALIVCQTPAAAQWYAEANRWVPKLQSDVVLSGMTKRQRVDAYVRNWDFLIIGWHMLLRDADMLEKLEVGTIIIDDVDPALNHETQAHRKLERLTRVARRSYFLHATPVQVKLEQLHAALMLCGGLEVFGTRRQFERNYVVQEPVTLWNPRTGRRFTQNRITGYKNVGRLSQKLAPMMLRRTYKDLDDVRIPSIMPPEEVWLEFSPDQLERYKELQKGVLKIRKEEGTSVKHLQAIEQFMRGQQICAGLPALGELGGASVKLDWVMAKLQGEWADEKVVVYMQNVGMIEDLSRRCDEAGIGYARIWGKEADANVREAYKTRFWNDPSCRVMMGTSAMEKSLNLQNARIIVFVDLILNPARVTQTVGRIRRIGSSHDRVFVFSLLIRDSQEERYMKVLETRQAVADAALDDESELFNSLSPQELLELIGG